MIIWYYNCLRKNSFDEGLVFIGSFKVGSVPGMINEEVLVQFTYTLHSQLKNCLSSKIRKNYYPMYIEERGWVNAQILLMNC